MSLKFQYFIGGLLNSEILELINGTLDPDRASLLENRLEWADWYNSEYGKPYTVTPEIYQRGRQALDDYFRQRSGPLSADADYSP